MYLLALSILLLTPPADPAPRAGTAAPTGGVAAATSTLPGFTAPRQRVTLAIPVTGRLGALHVEEGSSVEAGALLASLEDEVQRVRVEGARLQQESRIDVEAAHVRHTLAQHELDRIRSLEQGSLASLTERQRAEAELASSALAIQLEEYKILLFHNDFERERKTLEQMQLRAPFNGYVSRVLKRPGEAVEPRDGIIEFVQLDPLLIEVDCPIELSHDIRPGATVRVTGSDARWGSRMAKTVFVSRVADAASQTVRWRLQVENPDASWIAGMSVHVEMPTTGESAAAAR